MDKNQVVGLSLIFCIFMGYMFFFAPPEEELLKQQENQEVTTLEKTTENNTNQEEEIDTISDRSKELITRPAKNEMFFTLSNKDIEITLGSFGGVIKKAELKNYKSYDSSQVILMDLTSNSFDIVIPTKKGNISFSDLVFSTKNKSVYVESGKTGTIKFECEIEPGKIVTETYTLKDKGYEVGYNIEFKGLDKFIKDENILFTWNAELKRLENDLQQSRYHSTINYYTKEGDFDYLSARSDDFEEESIPEKINWISLKQRFFSSAFIADGASQITKADIQSNVPESESIVKIVKATFAIPAQDIKENKGEYRFFFGPNQFYQLEKVTEGFESNIDLGWAVFALFNRWLVIPTFAFLEQYVGSYGLIIILLVILVKILLFPLAYKSYLSMAKMRELKPELDELGEKFGDDTQGKQKAQMQLYSQVGVNPLMGCIPVVLQMPVLLALFNFFPNAIELRQEGFLWAPDLSTYDAVITFGFEIPFYGSHVSLFTLLMTLSTIVYTWYNNQINTSAQGPMKSVGYMMPVIFMFVLNSFPSGLTFYYFVSNIVTIGQQKVATLFIDKEKIRKVMEENKRNAATGNKKKSKFQARLEDALKAQEVKKKKKK